ncbi:unnamed protein product [Gemmataceae bacterium]|jgi:hypothetical protein|nr:unnamed protein product [Gemmataceae bacterium]VTU01684.1 unnamed protein product [Gemmataceae bacterium]
MLVRLLIAVLMLTGPNPVRACTCAASDGLSAPSFQTSSAVDVSVSGKAGCGCRNKTHQESPANAENASGYRYPACPQGGHTDSGGHPHHPDCPAVVSSPVVSAIPTPAPDAPTDCDVGVPIRACSWFAAPVRLADRFDSGHCFRSVPLYISLLTLRI